PRRSHARADACASGGGVGSGDKRVCAVVDIQQSALSAFEEDTLSGIHCPVQELGRVYEVLRQLPAQRLGLGANLVGIQFSSQIGKEQLLLADVILQDAPQRGRVR